MGQAKTPAEADRAADSGQANTWFEIQQGAYH